MDNNALNIEYTLLLNSLKQHVYASRHKAALSVNKELILLYHHIGRQIIEAQSKAAWGSKVIEQLANDLKSEFPEIKGFSHRNLKYMRQFAEEYPDQEFVERSVALLPWGHNVLLMNRIHDKKIRMFYIEKTIEHGWSRNIMGIQIETALHKRQGQATTNFKDKLPSQQSELAQNTLKDPYLFDFLSIGEAAHEREIEKALIQHIEKFLLELGEGFAFLGRQYHLYVDEQDFYIDLLFYHVKLRAFIVVELKAGKFKPEYAGKMNFYLSAVDDLLRQPGDAPSIGLILCKAKGGGVLAEYTLRDMSKPIGLAEYKITENLPENLKVALPGIEELEAELSKDLGDAKEDE
ncbi:MAG: YhcG family protein [Gammaproteobacteria bacterium]